MVNNPNQTTPFGLPANIAAAIAYLLSVIGGIVMLVAGGTDRFVRFAAAQSIVLFALFLVLQIAVSSVLGSILHLWFITGALGLVLRLLQFGVYIWTIVYAFQGKEARVPVAAELTESLFKSLLA